MRRIRQRLRLTQRALAEHLGVHVLTVKRWEAGVQGMRGPAERLLKLLAQTAVANSTPKRKRS